MTTEPHFSVGIQPPDSRISLTFLGENGGSIATYSMTQTAAIHLWKMLANAVEVAEDYEDYEGDEDEPA